ncbi:MAG: hypothetical protein K2M83_01890 [Muribaculaceae bacterium]|nr:hypothetical protein [Muribaculaceae bacterium]
MEQKNIISKFNRIIGDFYALTLSFIYDIEYKKIYKKTLKNRDFAKRPSKEEIKSYKKYWRPLSKKVNPIYLKVFGQYIEGGNKIVPEDISHNVIENILNPPKYRGYFSDKNMFDKIVGSAMLPKTYLRCIQGNYYDADYNPIELDESLIPVFLDDTFIIKPSIDTSSGQGVYVFEKVDGKLIDIVTKKLFSLSEIKKNLGDNFIIQERMSQSNFMSNLCKTSINTIRILVYRSVKDNQCRVLNSILRIGHDGAYVDNAHAGGVFIGIDEKGKLRDRVSNQYGDISFEHNGIDFRKQKYIIPNWNQIKNFACKVGASIPYHRCLNLDIMIDTNGEPKLIEFNIKTMSVWLYQFVNGPCFGDYTDEVIEYCSQNKHKIRSPHLMV